MRLEHVNMTVSNPLAMADVLVELFDWTIRWQGEAMGDGHTVHVGSDDSYLALYSPAKDLKDPSNSYEQRGGLNHVGIVVDDLAMIEARVKAAGFVPHNHANYEPGTRFYFDGPDGIEFEVIQYD